LAGEEFPNPDDRPTRVEDCIVSLSLARCYQAICASKGPNNGPHVAEWQHCRRLAECARELARTLDGFSPEEAYLVGLLCRLGGFPQLLGWKYESSFSAEGDALGVMLACHWNLPDCVVSAIRDRQEPGSPSKWRGLVSLAHQVVEQPVV
jgi:HD-like signal output (HDOD) protein